MSKSCAEKVFEQSVVKHLNKQSYFALQCTDSKYNRKVDLICIARNEKGLIKTHLIRCKSTGHLSQSEKEQLKHLAEEFNCIAVIASKSSILPLKFEFL